VSPKPRSFPSPHRFDVDLFHLQGVKVLEEPLPLLYSGLLRLRFGPPRDGMMAVWATWPRNEATALQRAMARAERTVPGDRRTPGQRDCDRFLTVVERVSEAIDVVHVVRAQRLFMR
jgi:hypothetical protein